MKKIISLLLISVALLSLFACSKSEGQLISELKDTCFDEYHDKEKFKGLTFGEIVSKYIADNEERFDVVYTYNEEIPQYDQIKAEYDTENYDYICAHVQVLTESISGKKIVEYSLNAMFSVDKDTDIVRPIGVASEESNWEIEKRARK